MRRLVLALLIFLALGPLPGTHMRFPVLQTSSQQIVARPLDYPADTDGVLRFVRGWRLVSPNQSFGGLSSLAVIGPDRFQFVGDNGWWTRLTLHSDGRVSGARIATLPAETGGKQRKWQRDVESMFHDPASGKSWMAFEGVNQVWRLDADLTKVESRARLPEPRWPGNRGPEAMVRLADGRTIIFSEDADDDPRGREALIFTGDPSVAGTKAIRFFYDSDGKGLVSDAAPLPDGRILLVHRRMGFRSVFTTVLAIVDPADIGPGRVVRSQWLARVPLPLADNYEGAAVEVRGGRTYVWLVSDDNFNSWQRTLLIQFELVGLPPRKPHSKKAAP